MATHEGATESRGRPEGVGAAPPLHRMLGIIAVDSGTILIGDPTYVLPNQASSTTGIDFKEVIDAPVEIVSRFGNRPVLLISAFGGDGDYPVIGEFDRESLVAVSVRFDVEPDGD